MKKPTKKDIAAIAKKLWPIGAGSDERGTVKAVLEAYRERLKRAIPTGGER